MNRMVISIITHHTSHNSAAAFSFQLNVYRQGINDRNAIPPQLLVSLLNTTNHNLTVIFNFIIFRKQNNFNQSINPDHEYFSASAYAHSGIFLMNHPCFRLQLI